uniref:Uncharacterized protein n=1 Tax=Myripristis murdjan TaxID=586833 RepID=A0A668A1Y5_9TELE
ASFHLTVRSSKTHLSLESISSSGLASFHWTQRNTDKFKFCMDWTMNLCLLFSFGS